MKITIYHNKNCSKSRQALDLLKKHNIEVEVIEYVKTPPNKETLQKLLSLLGMDACELIRKNERIYKEKYGNRDITNDECLEAMVLDPILIQRPIVVAGDKAFIARPPEVILDHLHLT